MPNPPRIPQQPPPVLKARLAELQASLMDRDPNRLAWATGCDYAPTTGTGGIFHVPLWRRMFHLSYPDFSLSNPGATDEPRLPVQAMVLYYFLTADGTPLANTWISLSELPDGQFYHRAFQGYTGQLLARQMPQRQVFERSAQQIGGEPVAFGGCAYAFQLLPRVPLLVVLWEGDEDFPSAYQILFDATCPHYLPLDACAIAGSMLTHQLLEAAKHVPGRE